MTGDRSKPAAAVVALTGGTGVLGRHLRLALSDRRVLLLSRRDPVVAHQELWVPTDLAQPVQLPDLPSGTALCHLAYALADGRRNLDYTRHLIESVNACPQVDHVVLVSSLAVYGLRTSGQLDERSPCRPDSEYARTKLACEELWTSGLRTSCRLTVLRPGAVLTPDGPALRGLTRDAVARPLRGSVKRSLLGVSSLHFVAVENVVAAIAFVLDRSAGLSRQVFVVSDDHHAENASYAAMQDAVRAVHGLSPLPTLPVPGPLVRVLGEVLGRPLRVRRRFSSQALRDMGFQDAVALREQVERVALAGGPPPRRSWSSSWSSRPAHRHTGRALGQQEALVSGTHPRRSR